VCHSQARARPVTVTNPAHGINFGSIKARCGRDTLYNNRICKVSLRPGVFKLQQLASSQLAVPSCHDRINARNPGSRPELGTDEVTRYLRYDHGAVVDGDEPHLPVVC
jgi:hypothetical protein